MQGLRLIRRGPLRSLGSIKSVFDVVLFLKALAKSDRCSLMAAIWIAQMVRKQYTGSMPQGVRGRCC